MEANVFIGILWLIGCVGWFIAGTFWWDVNRPVAFVNWVARRAERCGSRAVPYDVRGVL